MDKKSIIGLVLIMAIFIGYMFWVSPSKEELAERQRIYDSTMQANLEAQRVADSIATEQARLDSIAATTDSAATTTESGNTITLSNERMTLDVSTLGAMINRVVLADYQTFDKRPLELISPSGDNINLVFSTEDNRVVNTKNLLFSPYINDQPVESGEWSVPNNDSLHLNLRAPIGNGYLEFAYTFYGNSYEVGFDISFVNLSDIVRNTSFIDLHWHNRMNRQEKVSDSDRGKGNRNSDRERFYSSIYYMPPKDKVDNLSSGRDDHEQVRTNLDWIAFKQQYFAAILTSEGDQPFENAELEVSTNSRDTTRNYLTDMRATIGIPYSDSNSHSQMGFYFGPTKFRDLKAMDRGFEKMLPLGWTIFSKSVSRWLIIPIFNFLENFMTNYGLIIILFTLLIRFILLPLVYKSYSGSAIMRILKPEMDALNKKFPNPEQAMQKQQAMMALQKKAGYSPMAGCLPMLIQMPFLTAMFMFFPIAIELRQKPFLWCDDLSNYDSILDFGFNIPLYGDHISLFCLLMFGMQFFYTWYTMRGQNMNAGMPGMKFMMYFMPFMMLFIFNSQSAGLNLYYLISLTFTMTVMILIRQFTSEQKVRARMAAYDAKQASGKGKPQKKSKFQQRLEEMQKMAEQMQKEQNRRK